MSDAYILRRLGPDDAEAYRDVRLEGLARTPQAFTSALSEEEVRPLDAFREVLRTSHVLGAFEGSQDGTGGLQGVMGLRITDSPRTGHIGLIWGVYLREAARGTGVARRMLATLVDAARGRVEALELGVGVYNTPARRLYGALGFVEVARLPRVVRVGEDYYDELIMRRDFRDPDPP
jgi:RimJ/RimL family protein N-acetyltransferase